jgi:uncharacterized membrane protein YphA (DoxX/SURF4 family)
MIDPLLSQIVAYGFGLLFISSAWNKLSDIDRFSLILEDYQLLTIMPFKLLAVMIATFEFILGCSWLLGFSTSIKEWCTVGILILYTLAITVNLVRGRVYIDCGCGFNNTLGDNGHLLSPILVVRNFILIVMVLFTLLPTSERNFVFLDYMVIFSALLTIILLYVGSGQLIQNRSAINTWRNGF